MTTTRVDALETTLGELLGRVQAGETIVIASDGKDVAEISPCDEVLARLQRTFPGMRGATMPASSKADFRPWPFDPPLDAVQLIREEREDREFLR